MKEKTKKFLLGEGGAGIMLIIIQIIVGIKTEGSFGYLIGANISLIAGILSIIDGLRKLK